MGVIENALQGFTQTAVHPRGVRDDEAHAVVVRAEIHGVVVTVTHRGAFPGNVRQTPRHVDVGEHPVGVARFDQDEVAVVFGGVGLTGFIEVVDELLNEFLHDRLSGIVWM